MKQTIYDNGRIPILFYCNFLPVPDRAKLFLINFNKEKPTYEEVDGTNSVNDHNPYVDPNFFLSKNILINSSRYDSDYCDIVQQCLSKIVVAELIDIILQY